MKLLFTIAMSIGMVISCLGQAKNAAKYNDKIIDIQHAAIEKMARFAGSFPSTPLEILQKEKDKLELMLEMDIKRVASMLHMKETLNCVMQLLIGLSIARKS